jgi:hypothetical protein
MFCCRVLGTWPRSRCACRPTPSIGDALRLEGLHQVVQGVRLRVHALDVAVVDEQLGVGVGGVRPGQGTGDVAGAEALVPDRGAVAAVLVEGLVDHVPSGDLALVAAGLGADVVLQQAAELGGAPAAVVSQLGFWLCQTRV